MAKEHAVCNISFEDPILQMKVDGIPHAFDLTRHSKRLRKATPAQRANLAVSPSGYGIHWPDIDEDLSINGLIRGVAVDEPSDPNDQRMYENPRFTPYHPRSRPRPRVLRFLSEIRNRILGTGIAFPMDSTSTGIPMPTILKLYGWNFFFYADEGNEPVHIHCQKGGANAKYWLREDTFEVVEAYTENMSPADKRLVRKTICDHFDYFVAEWKLFEERKHG